VLPDERNRLDIMRTNGERFPARFERDRRMGLEHVAFRHDRDRPVRCPAKMTITLLIYARLMI